MVLSSLLHIVKEKHFISENVKKKCFGENSIYPDYNHKPSDLRSLANIFQFPVMQFEN